MNVNAKLDKMAERMQSITGLPKEDCVASIKQTIHMNCVQLEQRLINGTSDREPVGLFSRG